MCHTIPNPKLIHASFCRPMLLEYGIWDQVRVDQGKEWILMLYTQELLADQRRNTSRAPHLQTTSKMVKFVSIISHWVHVFDCVTLLAVPVPQNHCVERMWVEINGRVNYPVKACLVTLEERGDIDLDCPHQKFCISWFSIRVANIGTTLAIQAWNEHPIPGTVNRLDVYLHACLCETLLCHTDLS